MLAKVQPMKNAGPDQKAVPSDRGVLQCGRRARVGDNGGGGGGAPPGGHDDCVIALALAWHGAQQGGVGISFV